MRNLASISLVALAACGCNAVKEGFVVQEWSKNMRELGVYPVFPPREDLYVGDVFVSSHHEVAPADTSSTGLQPLGLHFASIDLTSSLNAHYAARPNFPASSASAPASKSIFDPPARQDRLKMVAFPFFLQATATGAEIGALIPVDALPWKAGLGLNSVKSASVTVSSAESYAAPWAVISRSVVDKEGKFAVSLPSAAASSPETLALLKGVAVSSDGQMPKYIDVTVVSEVFYARSFDVTMHLSSDAALSVAGSFPSAAESAASAATAAAASASQAARAQLQLP